MDVLVKAGANVNDRDSKGRTPLMLGTLKDRPLQMLETLLAAGADVTAQDAEGNTALHYAASSLEPSGPKFSSASWRQDRR